jgi:hypothetical protein
MFLVLVLGANMLNDHPVEIKVINRSDGVELAVYDGREFVSIEEAKKAFDALQTLAQSASTFEFQLWVSGDLVKSFTAGYQILKVLRDRSLPNG